MTTHGNFRTLQPLSDDQLRQFVPAVFAEQPEESVSARYGFIPTREIVQALRDEGFVPTFAQQCNVRLSDNENFTKHLLRFTLASDLDKILNVPKVVDGNAHHFFKAPPEIAQITLVNAHDRSSSYQLDAALWRMLCGNGLMVGGHSFESIHVRHSKGVVREVIEGTFRIIEEMPRVFERVEQMKQVPMTPRAQLGFAEAAAVLRWGNEGCPVLPDKLLNARRPEDELEDLWTTYNVVQENIMRGGLRGKATTGRRMTTREVKSVDEDVRLNRALWTMADTMREAAVH